MSEKGKRNGVYNEKDYETIAFPMLNGSKAIIKDHCDETGETYHAFLRRAVVNQIARDREAMRDPDVKANTRFEGWLHYEDNIRKQIVTSLEDWIKSGKKEPFDPGKIG